VNGENESRVVSQGDGTEPSPSARLAARGVLRRLGQKPLDLEEMREAIERNEELRDDVARESDGLGLNSGFSPALDAGVVRE